jgi:CelD/BcsL family acetyltransferase involved in cellulose biosynthesis
MSDHSMATHSKYHMKVIEKLDEFGKLKVPWNGLLENHRSPVPYLCHEWYEIWLKHYFKEDRLLILLLYKNGDLAAIAPFLLKRETFKGAIKVRKVELIGNIVSPIRTFIFGSSDEKTRRKQVSAIFNFFLEKFGDWDIIDLNSIPEEDTSWDIIRRTIKQSALANREYACFGNWYLDKINFSGDEYIRTRTSNIRNNIKRYRKKLEKMGKLELKTTSDEETDTILHFHYTVREKSWKYKDRHYSFHRDLAGLAKQKGWLRSGFLFLNDVPIASQLWIVCNRVAYIHSLNFDETYRKFIPGVILSAEMMKYVIDIDRVVEVDYLRGDEPYKKDWTPNRRERKGITIFNDNLKGRFFSFFMTGILPIAEKYPYLLSAKNKLSDYLEKKRR